MSNPDHYQVLRAVSFVLKHGSIEEAAHQAGLNIRVFRNLLDRAVSLGYLSRSDGLAKPPESRTGVVAHIPDLHEPFGHPDAPAFVSAVLQRYQPSLVIYAGDELDQHALSTHPTDPNGLSAQTEFDMGLARMKLWYEVTPRAKICTSNHGARPFRKAFLAGIPEVYLKEYSEFMQAPEGWEWGDEFVVDNVCYTHGEGATGANGALQLAIRQGRSQAVGHWHGNAGASFFHSGRHTVFGLYSGCLIDAGKYAFRYGKNFKLQPVLGMSIIDQGVPQFVPMHLNDKKLWTGRL